MYYFLIMAGGSGERFWPLSTKRNPKQVLKILNEKSMLQQTIDRLRPITSIDNIYVATNEKLETIIREQVADLPYDNLIIEPLYKDTAAAIGYGTIYIREKKQDGVIAVLASDHVIYDEEKFRKSLLIAINEAQINDSIVTFGIIPTKPETSYGYIKVESKKIGIPTEIIEFKEKPNQETALAYFLNGNYLWNSGMFIFKSDVIMQNFALHSKTHYEILEEIRLKNTPLIDSFLKFEKISIDYAIMEKTKNVKVIPVDFGWNDVGNFIAFEDIFPKNEHNTIIRNSKVYELDSANNIVFSENDTIVLIDINDLIIVKNSGKILITTKKSSSRIKEILKIYDNKGELQ